jgi:succinate dehydrogenase/fumarate reductase flavoprotein subunit
VSEEVRRVGSFRGDGGLDPLETLAEIKELAWETTGVVRNAPGLRKGFLGFEEIRKDKISWVKAKDQRGWIKALECANLAWVGEMVAKCALERRESRGQHYRDDYPQRDDANLLSWSKVSRSGDSVSCERVPIPFSEGNLKP